MKIGRNSVVAIDYTLRDDQGEVLDTSEGDEPLTYLHGHGQIVPGLENALEGRQAGEQFKAVVQPKDGYGERQTDRIVRVAKTELPPDPEPEVGMELAAVGPNGEQTALWVVEVGNDDVALSMDHPLAGMTLHFDVQVRDVREATREELEHGHAHGPDGHGHDDDHDHDHDHAGHDHHGHDHGHGHKH